MFADLNLRQSRWTGVSAMLGGGDLYLAFNVPPALGSEFKLLGGMGLMFAFVLAQRKLLAKYLEEET